MLAVIGSTIILILLVIDVVLCISIDNDRTASEIYQEDEEQERYLREWNEKCKKRKEASRKKRGRMKR